MPRATAVTSAAVGPARLTLYATVQEIPPDHRGGYTLDRDELVVEDADYDNALTAAQRCVIEGWQIIALRAERDSVAT